MVNHWWEIQITAEPVLEELIFWRLQTFGCQGTSSQDRDHTRFIRAYLHQSQAQTLDLAALTLRLRQDAISLGFPSPVVHWQVVNEEDWATSWKAHWHPQEIGDRLIIYPAWIKPPATSERLVLRLNPGVAFGTGAHATTELCLEALEMHLDASFGPVGKLTVADIGCGTGVLAIAAILLADVQIYAVDTDPLAVEAACTSRALNQIHPDQMVVWEGSVEKLIQELKQPVEGLVCNILAETIIELTPQFSKITRPGSWGIISGILIEQADDVAKVLAAHGWEMNSLWRRQDWCCLNISRV